ncbi:MAG: PBSX family phage terminase large subunit [Oscillospiraceae bacterium]|nr:PBSX family phage terminase large subunit [Oscillospiraceae bacterium]
MTFEKLSPKQKQVFKWCYNSDYKAIICDGAVRSGKTICMITSFILWAMRAFNGATFAICGKSVGSAERNIILPLQSVVDITHYFKVTYTRSLHLLTIEGMGKVNYFYIFGGKDEKSYQLIQGITLSGIFLDEVALMPQSFVNQAVTRTLSVENSRYWFNCNPESPEHWFYKDWVLRADEQNALHLHFLMSDNPTLTQKQLDDAERRFSGVFYDRYIKGLWVIADGLIYPFGAEGKATVSSEERQYIRYYISIDYGIHNPFSMGLWGLCNGVWYRFDEYYYSGRKENYDKTDNDYYNDLISFAKDYPIKEIIIDPSATSFIALMQKNCKFRVRRANNDVVEGIRNTATSLQTGKIKICDCCTNTLAEFSSYRWNEKFNEDVPIKENDHAMDDIRYFVNTVLYHQDGFFAQVR